MITLAKAEFPKNKDITAKNMSLTVFVGQISLNLVSTKRTGNVNGSMIIICIEISD